MFFIITFSLIDFLCDGEMFGLIMNIQLHRCGLIQTHCNRISLIITHFHIMYS
jgi:hypothetical protein